MSSDFSIFGPSDPVIKVVLLYCLYRLVDAIFDKLTGGLTTRIASAVGNLVLGLGRDTKSPNYVSLGFLVVFWVVTTVAGLWACFHTDYLPPLMERLPRHPFGDYWERVHIYSVQISANLLAMLFVVLGSFKPPSGDGFGDPIYNVSASVYRVLPISTLAMLALAGYSALYEPKLWSPRTAPPLNLDGAAWYVSITPMLAFELAIALAFVRWVLSKLAGLVPG